MDPNVKRVFAFLQTDGFFVAARFFVITRIICIICVVSSEPFFVICVVSSEPFKNIPFSFFCDTLVQQFQHGNGSAIANGMNFKLFCLAARRGNEHMVSMMAAQDTVFINGSNRRGRTALHVAAEFGILHAVFKGR